jgi:hypothetical protein
MLELFYYGVYLIIGIFVLRFIFWEIPMYFDSYWGGVITAAIGIAVLIGLGFLADKYEIPIGLLLLPALLIGVKVFTVFTSKKN